jgi:hypothetical protein
MGGQNTTSRLWTLTERRWVFLVGARRELGTSLVLNYGLLHGKKLIVRAQNEA